MSRDRDASRRRPGQRGSSARFLRDTLTAYAYLSPSALLIGVFGIFPLFFTIYVSLFKWRLARGGFAGLDNYARLLGGNLWYLAATLASLGGIVMAVFLFRRSRGARRGLWCALGVAVLAGSLLGLGLALPFLASQGDKDIFDSLRVTIWY
ncbi:MAG TPA: hypothetical protein VFB30_00565, partial [Spirochaetia bacterium]|nr:hypothetical protein [Spirochaetia bacterium]